MHPTPSIILFTALSGLGFGLIALLGFGATEVSGMIAFTFCALALGLVGAGLLASLFHLGRPERFLKAFTQWRSSWLSREGVMAMVTMGLFGLYALLWVFGDIRFAPLGWLSAISALVTVFCTAMIYAQLKTIPRWHSPSTPLIFLLAALSAGMLFAGTKWALLPLVMLGIAQVVAWKLGDGALTRSGTDLGTATGLGSFGKMRQLAPASTAGNYLLREMSFRILRKHREKLRPAGLLLAVVLPVLMLLFPASHISLALAILCHISGIILIRYLFFAEAEHVVGFYLGTR